MSRKVHFALLSVLISGLAILAVPAESFAAGKYSLESLPPLSGPKKTIAVMDFENKAGASAQWRLGEGMAEMLTTALIKSGRFIVVERQAITDVLAEQDFSASGRTVNAGAPKFGKILNAQIMVRGAVTEFGLKESGGGGAVRIKGFDIGLAGSQAHVGVDIRLYDTTTGQVIDSLKAAGKASSTGVDFGYANSGWGIGTGAFQNTPLGKATQQAIDKAVYLIASRMQDVSWEGRVIKSNGNEVFINAGAEGGINVGDGFTVYRADEELIDPQTGLSLGSETTKIGHITVTSVSDKFSKASIDAGSDFRANDIIRF